MEQLRAKEAGGTDVVRVLKPKVGDPGSGLYLFNRKPVLG